MKYSHPILKNPKRKGSILRLPFEHASLSRLQSYLRGWLSDYEMSATKFHLVDCDECRDHFREVVNDSISESKSGAQSWVNAPAPLREIGERSEPQLHLPSDDGLLDRQALIVDGKPVDRSVVHSSISAPRDNPDWAYLSQGSVGFDNPTVIVNLSREVRNADLSISKLSFETSKTGTYECELGVEGKRERVYGYHRNWQAGDMKLSGRSPTEGVVIENPTVLAISAVFDDENGLVGGIAERVMQVRGPISELVPNSSVRPSGAMLALYAGSLEYPYPECSGAAFSIQGLIAAETPNILRQIALELESHFSNFALAHHCADLGQIDFKVNHWLWTKKDEQRVRSAATLPEDGSQLFDDAFLGECISEELR